MVILMKDLQVRYRGDVLAIDRVHLKVQRGEFVSVIGPSGAGKTSLLRCINGMVKPSGGRVQVMGIEVADASPQELRLLRRKVACIHQQFNLVKRSSTLTNALCGRLGYVHPLASLCGIFPKRDVELAADVLADLGLEEKMYRRVDRLSGGEQQRVAIARALLQEPAVILADEPMASLDMKLARQVLDILARVNREKGVTVIASLHMLDLAREYGQRVIGLNNGRIVYDGAPDGLTDEVVGRIYQGRERHPIGSPTEQPVPAWA